MLTIFGKPAVLIPQPGGELEGYQIEGLVPDPPAVRAWKVTSPKGEAHTVTEFPRRWACSCDAFTRFTKYGCRHKVGHQFVCKHVAGLARVTAGASRPA